MNRKDLLTAIRARANEHGMKVRLATALGISRQTVHNKLNNDEGFSDEDLAKIAVFLDIDTDAVAAPGDNIIELPLKRGITVQEVGQRLLDMRSVYASALEATGYQPSRSVEEMLKAIIFKGRFGPNDVEDIALLMDALKREREGL